MQARKLEFSHDVMRIIREIGELAFNVKSENDLERIFGLPYPEMQVVIEKVVSSLPEKLFDGMHKRLMEEIENIFAREFIFFQVQEKTDDPRYEEDLANFIHVFSRDIEQRIDMYKNYKSKMKEE